MALLVCEEKKKIKKLLKNLHIRGQSDTQNNNNNNETERIGVLHNILRAR